MPLALLRTAAAGEKLGSWEVLHPRAIDRFPLADDLPLVLRASLQGTTVLLCSDLAADGQNALMERAGNLQADIVVAGIPSRGEPLGDALLDRIHPRLIIINAAYYTVPEQAKAPLRERLARRGVPVIYTCDAGSATLEFRRGAWKIRTMNGL